MACDVDASVSVNHSTKHRGAAQKGQGKGKSKQSQMDTEAKTPSANIPTSKETPKQKAQPQMNTDGEKNFYRS
jgi:hypothetical protein